MTRSGQMSLRDFWANRNRVLFLLPFGGLGDVFIQRMMFWDVKRIFPEVEIHFAVLDGYADAVRDHPLVSGVHCAKTINPSDFMMHYKTCVSVANRYENAFGIDCSMNRSDIWAMYCGFSLQKHDMQIAIDQEMAKECRDHLESISAKSGMPILLYAPVSAVRTKTLLESHTDGLLRAARDMNIVVTHSKIIPSMAERNIPGIYGMSIKKWMHYIYASDYVVAADSAAFHVAGGLGKPLIGIFTFANGKTYGKYYDFVMVQRHRDDGDWDCGPCYDYKSCKKTSETLKPCLTTICGDDISRAVENMIAKWPSFSLRLPLATRNLCEISN